MVNTVIKKRRKIEAVSKRTKVVDEGRIVTVIAKFICG